MEKKHDKSIIRNYTEVDWPLYSYDRIFAMGNDTLIVELYDTLAGAYSEDALQVVKGEYADLAERDPGEHWAKKRQQNFLAISFLERKSNNFENPCIDCKKAIYAGVL